jgi:hypothetical protein
LEIPEIYGKNNMILLSGKKPASIIVLDCLKKKDKKLENASNSAHGKS